MTTASKITMVRIGLIPVFALFMYLHFPYSDLIALIIFAAASLTDGLDGYIARKYNQVSTFGKFIDPLADKLLVVAALILFVERGQMWGWAALTIITREFAVTALRLVAVEGGLVIAAGVSGKIKTAVTMLGICVMLTPIGDLLVLPDGMGTVSQLCVILMVLTTLWSGIEYFIKNWKVLNIGQ